MIDFTHALTLLIDKLNDWIAGLVTSLPNLLVAILVLSIGSLIAKRLRSVIRASLARLLPNKPTLLNFTATIAYIAMVVVVVFIALRFLHLDKAITTALAGAGIVGLALAFAFQDIAANFISGVFLAFRRPFNIGDAVKVKDFEGFIQSIELRDTTLRTYQGHIVTIPNKDVLQSTIVNFTRLGKRRADVIGSVCKSNDLRKVQDIALRALHDVPGVIDGQTDFLFDEITDSVIHFRVQTWVASSERLPWQTFVSNVIITLNETFKANGIAVPNDEYTLLLSQDVAADAAVVGIPAARIALHR